MKPVIGGQQYSVINHGTTWYKTLEWFNDFALQGSDGQLHISLRSRRRFIYSAKLRGRARVRGRRVPEISHLHLHLHLLTTLFHQANTQYKWIGRLVLHQLITTELRDVAQWGKKEGREAVLCIGTLLHPRYLTIVERKIRCNLFKELVDKHCSDIIIVHVHFYVV